MSTQITRNNFSGIAPVLHGLGSTRFWGVVMVSLVGFFPSESWFVLGAVAHVLIGWVEIGLKSLLEGLFGLSHRAAQVVVAWTGLGVMIVLLIAWIRFMWRLAKAVAAFVQTLVAMALITFELAYVPPSIRAVGYAIAGFSIAIYGLL